MLAIFQHGPDESPGVIGEYLEDNRIPHEIFRVFDAVEVPRDPPSHLIVLGGQMSVNDTGSFPFLAAEKAMVRSMIEMNRPVLGICLGAQMIAAALGYRVYSGERERGWCQIHGCDSGMKKIVPDSVTVFQWHDETFDLPEGACLIATGERIKNQAFRFGSAVGVQFHPEVTSAIIARWSQDLEDSSNIWISGDQEQHMERSRHLCHSLIRGLLGGWSL